MSTLQKELDSLNEIKSNFKVQLDTKERALTDYKNAIDKQHILHVRIEKEYTMRIQDLERVINTLVMEKSTLQESLIASSETINKVSYIY